MTREKRLLILMGPAVVLLLAALACGPVATVVVTATPPAAPSPTPETAAPIPTAAPPTESPPPEPTTAAGCTLGARWVADVTVPDDTVLAPGTPFLKTWRVRNSGTCAWEPETRLVFISGTPMGGPSAVDVPALAPGAQTDVSVNLTAPAAPGTYRANYQFQAPDGTRFGAVIWVQIVVPAPATAAPPTDTPTPVPPSPTDTPAPSPQPDLYVSEYAWTPETPRMGSPFRIRVGVYNQGNAPTGPFRVEWWLTRTGPAPTCTWDVSDLVARGGRILECDYTPEGWADYPSQVVVDSGNTVVERDEGNNRLERTIPVRPGAQTWSYAISVMERRTIYYLRLTGPGEIRVRAEWTGSASNLALIINGPGRTGYYARRDGPTPLEVAHTVTAADFASGDTWRVSVVNFGGGEANVTVRITYPSGSSTSPFTEQTTVASNYGRAVNVLVLRGTGTIQAQANWSGAPANMALIINGPGRVGYYARQDGGSPLSVSYDVTAADWAAGDTWRVSIAAFSAPDASGNISLMYP